MPLTWWELLDLDWEIELLLLDDAPTAAEVGPVSAGARRCSVDGCDRPHQALGYCQPHRRRWRKYGDPGPAEVRTWERGRTCSVDGCDRPHEGGGHCEVHRRRLAAHGELGPRKVQPPHGPRRSTVTYTSAHDRVESARGRAAAHRCHQCQAPAREWAYDHQDPAALTCPRGRPYSLDPSRYIPLCVPCHRRFDRAHSRGEAVT